MKNTKIEWCDHTHNFWHGCTKVSPACKHCYADALSNRFQRVKFGKGEPRWQPSQQTRIGNPHKWNEEAKSKGIRYRVFTLSMGDFFDDEVDPAWREEAWEVIKNTPHLDWLILTKRPENIRSMLPDDWGNGWDNVWLGTTVEDQKRADLRIPILTAIPAKVRFLSMEPLLEPVVLKLDGIDWVIVGGESGPSPRPIEGAWVEVIRQQCRLSDTAFFFKQWGGRNPKKIGRELNGRTYDDFPLQPLTNDSMVRNTFDFEGKIVESSFWGSLYECVGMPYITFEGGIVRLLMPEDQKMDMKKMKKAKVTAITVGSATPEMKRFIPVRDEVVEIFFDDKKITQPYFKYVPTAGTDYIDQLPSPGSVTKLEVWEWRDGRPRRSFKRKCLVRDEGLLNYTPVII